MIKIANIFILASVSIASCAWAYMPPPSKTHWDGYGSDPYTPGPTQANQLNQTAGRPPDIWQQQPFDPNFNNNQFQTSSPNYNAPENQRLYHYDTNMNPPY
jgi:hypothetical protein